ncbi:NADH:flavin oxidoreductase [Pelosinus sp. UFO1]|uniref:NADH:flavin oxidoreductase n=1 Tax=Pelosinus sp. UFO1 TaxID=484770 RepID=UPI0004D16512|nr:NADH:flavin oxidoreductase [Pelosinus sp. UFO1]AIF49755.1 NADPH dehydrogenase [Pelosinus sp. UFO1]
MGKLSDEIIIRGKKIKNRIVMPPMMCFSFKGDNGGMYGEQYVDHYTRRAKGGTGLIIVQATSAQGAAKQLDVWSDEQMKPLEKIAQNCHNYGAAVMMQLSYGDININELSVEEIHTMQLDCIAAASRAKQAGFDGVEYHFAHGYTLCRFLDPTSNTRTDSYGGILENRVRFLTEILPQIRVDVGEEFIVSIRMGGNIPDVAGAIEVAKVLEETGIDLLHVSFGMKEPNNTVPDDFICSTIAFNGSEIKKHVNIPVIAVSEIFTAEQARFLVENEYVDFVAIGRGIFADENWANKVLANESIQQCRNCGGITRKCLWFIDHTKCPAKKSS